MFINHAFYVLFFLNTKIYQGRMFLMFDSQLYFQSLEHRVVHRYSTQQFEPGDLYMAI